MPELTAAWERVVRSTHFIMGPDVGQFEIEAARYLGVKHAIGVNSGTDALVIALRALGVGPGDEVITTPFSFFATAESISSVGATPVFVDVGEDSFNIDPESIGERISARTKAIIPVHLYGEPCRMTDIMELATAHGLFVLEDCAQSFGATSAGRQTGGIGHVGAFSFFPSKNLGAFGDAGLITTNLDDIAELARMLRAHGAKRKYENEMIGYNSRMDTLQAAILRVKLPHVDRWNQGRRRVASIYNELLEGVQGVVTPAVTQGHVFHQYTIRVIGADRDHVKEALKSAGIESMIYYPVPQDKLKVYAGQHPNNPRSDGLANEVLSLPIWPSLERNTQEYIADVVRSALS
jgi:dTDP-4-amino-4,6-dideoxygalactose transaminase